MKSVTQTMASEITIIFNEDAKQWANYLEEHLSNQGTVKVHVFLQEDTDLFTGSLNSRSQTRILNCSVVLIIMTQGHLEFLLSKPSATYGKLVPRTERGLLFLVGLSEEQINNQEIQERTRNIFPNYSTWAKVTYNDASTINTLQEKILEIMERPDPLESQFSVIPTVVHCEEETTVVALIDTAISEEAEVKALVRGVYIDEDLPCQRVNPYSYTFVMPRSVEDEVIINIHINKQSLRSQVKMFYKSYLSCSEQTAISEIYCHMLDKLCCYIRGELKTLQATDDLDQRLCDVFDHTIDLPAVGYEKLFGIYQYLTEGHSRTRLPNLVHLCAEHNLRELVAHLQDLPHFTKALCISNSKQMTPRQNAERLGFKDLAEFFQDHEEKADQYAAMMFEEKVYGLYYNKKAFRRTPPGQDEFVDYVDLTEKSNFTSNNHEESSQEEYYMDMEQSATTRKESSSIDLLDIQKKYKRGELSADDAQRAFTEWQQKHMDSSSKSFRSKQAALKKINEELSKVTASTVGQNKQGQHETDKSKKTSKDYHTGRESIPPPIPNRMTTKRDFQFTAKNASSRAPPSYLDLQEKSRSETGEEYDYADRSQWIPSPERNPTPSHKSSNISSPSSGHGGFATGSEFSVAEVNLPKPPPLPKRKEEKKKERKGSQH